MESDQKPLSKHFKLALPATLLWIVSSFWIEDALGMNYRVFGVSMAAGWLPMVVVAWRRPQTPTKLDLFALFAGHPLVFFLSAAFNHWYFHKH